MYILETLISTILLTVMTIVGVYCVIVLVYYKITGKGEDSEHIENR